MDIVIKKMQTDAEIRGKAYVHYRAWQEAYRGLMDPAYLDSVTLEKCEKAAYRWPDNILVAKDGENVVGFVVYSDCRDEDLPDAGEVVAIYVLSGYYGTGTGQKLMDAALGILDRPCVAVWVLRGNARAIRFYEKNGFVFDGAQKPLSPGAKETELRMILTR